MWTISINPHSSQQQISTSHVGASWSQETDLVFIIDLTVVFNSWRVQKSVKWSLLYLLFSFFFLFSFYLFIYLFIYLLSLHCEQQEEPAVVIAMLLLRIRRMHEAGNHLDFH